MQNIRQTIYTSKAAGFRIILVIYLIAIGMGVLTFLYTDPGKDILWRLFLADFVATVFVWLAGAVFDNASVYDPYWSVAPPVMLTLLAVWWQSYSVASLLLLTAVWVWGIRLTVNWAFTFKNLGTQDWRYDTYKEQFPQVWQLINLTGIHLMPTLIVFLAMIPGFYLLQLAATAGFVTYIGFCICIGAALLQWFSDRQMHRFRREQPGKVCNTGLWSLSRHPNYLGEIAMWWGVYVMLLSVSEGFYTWTGAGALVNTLLFIFISIPLMEKRQLVNKPEYSDYCQTTPKLFPRSFTIKRP